MIKTKKRKVAVIYEKYIIIITLLCEKSLNFKTIVIYNNLILF